MTNDRPKPGYQQTEVGVIPDDWETSPLSEKARVIDSLHKTPNFCESGYPMVRVADIKPGNLRLDETLKVSDAVFEEFTRNYKPKRGDIVLSRVGSYGVSSFVETDEPFCLGQNTVVIESKVPSRFLYYALNANYIREQIEDGSYGSGYKSLSLKNIKELTVALPSTISEQEKLAQALSDVDALIAALDKAIAKKRHLKTATMQQLLTGKKRLPGFGAGKGYQKTEIGTIPEDWNVKHLKDALKTNPRYGINAAAVPYRDSLPIYIRITDISEAGYFAPESLVSVNQENSDQYYLEEGDLVFARTGASVGKSYLYNPNDGKLVFAGFLIRIRPNENILLPDYLSQYVRTKAYWDWVQLMSMRSGQPGINGNEYGQLLVPFPDMKEQRAIATVLSDMDAEIAALETRRAKTQALKQGMMQQLLTGKVRLKIEV